MNIYFVCVPSELSRERRGYFEAFSRACTVALTSGDEPLAPDALAIYPDPPLTPMPATLPDLACRTACFQIDSFSKHEWRALWSCFFDYAFEFHPPPPSYESVHQHPNRVLLPHAVNAAEYQAGDLPRRFDLGWVGSSVGPTNASRRRLLPLLARRFRMNDWTKHYREEDVASVYLQSKIVVNISRDDYPEDANTRCFEAMAAGALLCTRLPTELTGLGFRSETDFVGYDDEAELLNLIARYLQDDAALRSIADAGRAKVLAEHTYDVRVRTLLGIVGDDTGARLAPARQWTAEERDQAWLHYYCKRVMWRDAERHYRAILRRSLRGAAKGMPLLLRCAWHALKNSNLAPLT